MNPVYDFSGQVALVTGAGSGLGLATAREFAKAGAAVVVADINVDAASQVADGLSDAGHQALAVACDVSDEEQIAGMIKKGVEAFGRLDVAFNNAGIIEPPAEVADATSRDYDRITAVNARGVWLCMKYELLHMRTQNSGAIVNCASLSGLVGNPRHSIYNASKHAVVGMTKSAALEYAAHGIRINAVCPGAVDTNLVSEMVRRGEIVIEDTAVDYPMGRIGRPEEIADAVLWLCSPGASYVVGAALSVDAGYVAK